MKPIHYVTVGLLIIILVMLWLWPDVPKYDSSLYTKAIQESETKIKALGLQNQALRDSVKKDSITYVQEREAFSVKIGRLNRRLADQRPKVDSIIQNDPVLIEYVATADSVIETQGYRIAALEHMNSKLSVNITGIIGNFESQISAHVRRFEAQKALTEDYRKEARKQKRQKRIAIGAGIIGVVGALLIER
jgi:hypothetical protein